MRMGNGMFVVDGGMVGEDGEWVGVDVDVVGGFIVLLKLVFMFLLWIPVGVEYCRIGLP